MGNSDTKKLIQYGEWIEDYLNPDISPFEFKKLAYRGIKYLGMDYKIDENDLTFQLADLVLNENNYEHKTYYRAYAPGCKNCIEHYEKVTSGFYNRKLNVDSSNYQNDYDAALNQLPSSIVEKAIEQLKDPLQILNLVRKAKIEVSCETKEEEKSLRESTVYPGFCRFAYEIFLSMTRVEMTFRFIMDQKEPWSEALINQWHNFDDENPWEQMRIYIKNLILWYGKTNDTLEMVGNTFKRLLSFTPSDRAYGKINPIIFNHHLFDVPKIYPWYIVTSRIAFDFLMLGGDRYYIFCKHCGRFTAAKRLKKDGAPEKIFCSPRCRTANKMLPK